MAEPIRDNIKTRRKRLGMSRRELAQRIGKSYKHIWGIEQGQHPASEETLQAIANVLGCQLGDVMANAKEPTGAEPAA